MTDRSTPQRLLVGRIAGAYGVRGWVRVTSFTDPVDNILTYSPWWIDRGDHSEDVIPRNGRVHGRGVVVRIDGVDDRDEAAALRGAEITVDRDRLPPAGDDRYYWADLVGLRVVNADGVEFGRVDRLMETGANDVLVIHGDRERLVPFVPGRVVRQVDLDSGTIVVDWDAGF